MRTTRRYAYAALLAASLLTAPLHAAEWINTWAASPLPNAATPGPGPAPLHPDPGQGSSALESAPADLRDF